MKAKKPAVSFDTNIIVAALCSFHREHEKCAHVLNRELVKRSTPVLAVHVVYEALSVMTRLPAPYRIAPRDALQMLTDSLRDRVTLAGLEPTATWDELTNLVGHGASGGALYDGLILAAVKKAHVSRFYTLNPKHFLRFDTADVEIIDPSSPGRSQTHL